MTRILVSNTVPAYNRGSMARLIGLLECLQKSMPEAYVTIWHRFYKKERDLLYNQVARVYPGIELKEHPWYRESGSKQLTAIVAAVRGGVSLFGSALNRGLHRLGLPLRNKYQPYDVIIDPNHVESDQSISAMIGLFLNLSNTMECTMSGKPVMICSATMPTLKRRFIRVLVRKILNRVALITLREELSRDNLRALGINKPPIIVTADLAFLLQPISTEKLDTLIKDEKMTRPVGTIVGITPASEPSFAKTEEYVQLMSMISDFIIEELKATVLLVANTSYDAPMVSMIKQSVKNKDKVMAFTDFYAADEVKGIIGMSNIFISPRFHALVAACSQAVPSIGIVTYNVTKFHGIIGRSMGQEHYLIDVSKFDRDILLAEIKARIGLLWLNKDSVAKELEQRADIARRNALRNGELVKELVASSKKLL